MKSPCLLLFLLASSFLGAQGPSGKPVLERMDRVMDKYHAQVEVVPEGKILDGRMIPIGSTTARRGSGIWKDPGNLYQGKPSYYFWMENEKGRRVELQNLFVTRGDLDRAKLTPDEIAAHQKNATLYHFGKGEARKGERWIYQYGLFLPSTMTEETSGIITQWHGMPDHTTLRMKDGKVVEVPFDDFRKKYLVTMSFEKAIAVDDRDGKPNGIIRDSGGNPPMALKVGHGSLYLVCRVDNSRVTVPGERVHLKPPLQKSKTSPEGNKTIFGVWEKKLSELPSDEWIDMKFEVYWPELKKDGSGLKADGEIKLSMNGELMADWKGPLGNHDDRGTYFKYGIYVPGKTGIEVWEAGFQQKRVTE